MASPARTTSSIEYTHLLAWGPSDTMAPTRDPTIDPTESGIAQSQSICPFTVNTMTPSSATRPRAKTLMALASRSGK